MSIEDTLQGGNEPQASSPQSSPAQAATTNTTTGSPQSTGFTIPPLDDFIERFTKQYKRSAAFRRDISEYGQLRKLDALVFGTASKFKRVLPSFYEQQVRRRVRGYAVDIHRKYTAAAEQLKGISGGQEILERLGRAQIEGEQAERESALAQDQIAQMDSVYRQKQEELAQAAQINIEQAEKEAQAERARVIDELNVKKAIERHLQTAITQTGLVTKTDNGVRFDNSKIMDRIGDLFLKSFTYDQRADSDGGFLNRIQTYFSDGDETEIERRLIQDPGEMVEMDLVGSILESAIHGYDYIQYPYVVIEERKRKSLGRIGVDTYTAIDVSGSTKDEVPGVKLPPMLAAPDEGDHYLRVFDIEKQVGLAIEGMMRKLHKKNTVKQALFSSGLKEVTREELFRETYPNGATNTPAALEWLADQAKANGNKPTIANLITDGRPEIEGYSSEGALREAVKSAERFRSLPNTRLTIFLVYKEEAEETAKANMRRVGEAAGPGTRYVTVPAKFLGRNVIEEIANSIEKIYTQQNF